MVFVEGDDYRSLRRAGDDPAQFRSPVRLSLADPLGSVVTDGLIAWYRAEDGTGTDYTNELSVGADQTAYDLSLTGASHLPSGGVADFQEGSNSGAFRTDGIDDVLINSSVPVNTNGFSISFFVEFQSFTGDFGGLVAADRDPAFDFFLLRHRDSTAEIQLLHGDGSSFRLIGTPRPSVGTVTHFGATFDGSTVRLFKDGSQVASVPQQGSTTGNLGVRLGQYLANGNKFSANIDIDEIRLFGRPIQANEMSTISQNGRA
jgi:hypothetical protein